jgi:hypothetical protein
MQESCRLSLARLITEMPCQASVGRKASSLRESEQGNLSLESLSIHSLTIYNRRHRHVDLSHPFRLRILHQDTARNSQAQHRPILQHHSRKNRQLLRTFTRRAAMETDAPSDEDALPSATAAQSACLESQ